MQTVIGKIVNIIRENFPNGIRNDYIDTLKVLRLYSSCHADESVSRAFVTSVICANGIELGGRFYFLSDKETKVLTQVFKDNLERHSIVYYSVFYRKFANDFLKMNIFSPEVLKKILQANDSRHHYFEDFCVVNKMFSLEHEIERVFKGTDESLSLEDLQEKLPFVPPEKILPIVSDTKKYLTTKAGKYFFIMNIHIDKSELLMERSRIFYHIDKKGYADPDDYDFSSNFALNPEISEKDLLRVIHEHFLSSSFTRQGGKFFGRKTAQSNARQESNEKNLMQLLTEQDEIDLTTLLSTSTISTVLSNALKIMVRVSEKLFVRATRINFDIDEVDAALTPFVQEKVIPLRAVTSFSGFPPVEGYSWNLFMLESFLRRYSRKYRFMSQSVGSSNIGAIYPRSIKFDDYFDVQFAAVLNSNIPLETVAVQNFLIDQGYSGKYSTCTCEQIISKALSLTARAAT